MLYCILGILLNLNSIPHEKILLFFFYLQPSSYHKIKGYAKIFDTILLAFYFRNTYFSWLAAFNHISAGKKKSVRITRDGVYLKPALVQCAHAAVKSDKSPYYKKKYDSLVKRRGKKRAIIAIARMILTAIYQMLSTGEQWNPSDLYKIDMPVALVEKQKAKAIKQAKKLLQREGLLPPDEPLAS